MSDGRVRVRGIYATALTRRLREAGFSLVQPSDPIDRRFDGSFHHDPASVRIETTADDQGVGLVGTPEVVADVRDTLSDLAIDVISWPDPAPAGAVFDGVVDRTRGGGAVVELSGGAEGYLPFEDVDGYVDVGDCLRVQVHDPEPPWTDRAPRLGTDVRVETGLVTLRYGTDGVTASGTDADATELVRTTDLLSASAPEGWGIHWEPGALDAGMEALETGLERVTDVATDLDDALESTAPPGEDTPTAVEAPWATAWCWFGREGRVALDEIRREVVTTMTGHHRIKASSSSASTAVDLVEAVCDDPTGSFPFAAVANQLGPTTDDELAIDHGKPDGRVITLGTGTVSDVDPDEHQVTVRRTMSSRGTYDGLGTDREPGDVAITKLKEGRWWYPTVYRGQDGDRKGTYVNVCTPVELFPGRARYVDLHVDVVKYPDGTVERVDEVELDQAVDDGYVSDALAAKARSVAAAVERALS